MNTDSRLLYTPEHAAAQLDIGRTHLFALLASGELRPPTWCASSALMCVAS
jgi:hypothetical protein